MTMKAIFNATVVVVSIMAVAEAQNMSQFRMPQRNAVTSYAVKTCGGNGGLSVSNVGMVYYRFNRSVEFSMIGTAKKEDLFPTMNIDVAAYGTILPTQVINLCNYASCPLFQNSTPIHGAQTLNRSFTNQIPSIFWKLPLDPTVKITFVTSDKTLLSCFTATLSNGITTKNDSVPWVTGLLTILLLIASGALANYSGAKAVQAPGLDVAAAGDPGTTLNVGNAANTPGVPQTGAEATAPTGHSGPPAGNMDPITLFLHFQSISFTGLLSLNYPSVYHAFTTNFAWANFIIPLKAFRKAAAHMRKCNVDSGNVGTTFGVSSVNSGSGLAVSSGIANYSERVGVKEQDIFDIIYLVFLCACGILLLISTLVGSTMHIASLVSKDEQKQEMWRTRRSRWTHMSSNNTLRLLLVALGTLSTFAFYQWTQKCTSGLTFFLSTSVLAIAFMTLGFTSYYILRISRRPDGLKELYAKDGIYGRRWGAMYDTLNEKHLYFAVAIWVVAVIRGAITGFGQGSGLAQVVTMTVLQSIICIALYKFRPYYSRGYNRVTYLLEGTKLVSHVLLFLFVDTFHISPTATTASGFVLLAINAVVALVLIVLIVLQLGWGRLWYRRRHIAFDIGSEAQEAPGPVCVYDAQTVSSNPDEEK